MKFAGDAVSPAEWLLLSDKQTIKARKQDKN